MLTNMDSSSWFPAPSSLYLWVFFAPRSLSTICMSFSDRTFSHLSFWYNAGIIYVYDGITLSNLEVSGTTHLTLFSFFPIIM